jgi:hypothetical protein
MGVASPCKTQLGQQPTRSGVDNPSLPHMTGPGWPQTSSAVLLLPQGTGAWCVHVRGSAAQVSLLECAGNVVHWMSGSLVVL